MEVQFFFHWNVKLSLTLISKRLYFAKLKTNNTNLHILRKDLSFCPSLYVNFSVSSTEHLCLYSSSNWKKYKSIFFTFLIITIKFILRNTWTNWRTAGGNVTRSSTVHSWWLCTRSIFKTTNSVRAAAVDVAQP